MSDHDKTSNLGSVAGPWRHGKTGSLPAAAALLRRWPSPWGAPGMFALACGTLAATTALGLSPRWQHQAEVAEQAARDNEARAQAVRRLAQEHARISTQALQLPAAAAPDERLADLLEAAVRAGVSIERIQQRADVRGSVQALQVGLAANGSYAELRLFIASALGADPALALERVQLRRASAASGKVDADLQWALLRQVDGTSSVPPAGLTSSSQGVLTSASTSPGRGVSLAHSANRGSDFP